MRQRPTLTRPLLSVAAALGLAAGAFLVPATPASALDEPAETAQPAATEGSEAVPAAEPAPAAAKKPYFRKGRQRLRLAVGYNDGDTVRAAGIQAAPLTGEPGEPNYPVATPLDVVLDGGVIFNGGYTYFFNEKWGLDLGLSHLRSELVDTEFDVADVDAQLATTNLSADEKEHLRTRMMAHATSHDISLTTFDVNAARIFKPASKWPFELAAGIGWSFSSLGTTTIGDRIVYERLVTSRVVNPVDTAVVANDIPADLLPYVEAGCLSDNDPCIEMTEQGGLTWNIAATAHHAFTDKLMLDMGFRVRITSQAVDPGDEFVTPELNIGLSFLFGGD